MINAILCLKFIYNSLNILQRFFGKISGNNTRVHGDNIDRIVHWKIVHCAINDNSLNSFAAIRRGGKRVHDESISSSC